MTTLFEENRDNELNFIFILLSMVTVSLMHVFLLISIYRLSPIIEKYCSVIGVARAHRKRF